MAQSAAPKPLTGWHVLAWLLSFFGVVIGVNLALAYFAGSTFSGLVVANGYVASQSFAEDLAKAKADAALDWQVNVSPAADRLQLTFRGPDGAALGDLSVTGRLERPAASRFDQVVAFTAAGHGIYAAPARLQKGLWELDIEATGHGVEAYRHTLRFVVKD